MQNDETGNVRGWKGDPGPQGHWKVDQIPDTIDDPRYLLSPKQWPNWYMYMQSDDTGNVRGWKGDPGPQGHWMITSKGTIIIDGVETQTFLFHPEKWPNWYMYMQSDDTGNVRGWKGDPGPQGHFMMAKAPGT